MNTPKETIQKELKIGHTQYYSYIDAAEEIVDDFVLGLVDHGLVLQFKTILQRVQKRAERLDEIVNKSLDKFDHSMDVKEKNTLARIIETANNTDKLYSEMLSDTKLVNQAVKTLNKVALNNLQNKK